jgi:hypothetical protein
VGFRTPGEPAVSTVMGSMTVHASEPLQSQVILVKSGSHDIESPIQDPAPSFSRNAVSARTREQWQISVLIGEFETSLGRESAPQAQARCVERALVRWNAT